MSGVPAAESILLRNAAWIYTCDPRDTMIENGWVHVRGNQIAAIGREPCPVEGATRSHDLRGCILIPGMVNLHHHFFQTLTRAMPTTQRALALDWLFGLYPLWAELDRDAIYWASAAASAELLMSGATTSVDHSYLLPKPADRSAAAQVEASRSAGIRLELVHGCLPVLEADLGERLRPIMGDGVDRLTDHEPAMFEAMEATIAGFHDPSRLAMTRVSLGPTCVSFAKPKVMRRIAEIAARNGCGLHTHLHPRPIEHEMARRYSNMTLLDFLADIGWLRPGTWFAHCTELSDAEMDAFAAHGCGVAHCARTVVRLGYALTRLGEMRRRGVKVGIGVDGPASNDGGAMLAEARLAHVLHRVGSTAGSERDWMTPYETLLMATRVGAEILRRDDIGHLALGMAADLAAFDMRRVAFTGTMLNPLGGLLACGSDASAALTMVNGKVVVERGRLLTIDEGEIIDQADAATRRMLAAAEARTGLTFRAAAAA